MHARKGLDHCKGTVSRNMGIKGQSEEISEMSNMLLETGGEEILVKKYRTGLNYVAFYGRQNL